VKIVYFYQYFSTPKGSWGTRVYEFCKEWVAQGNEVTVVTSIYAKSDLVASKLIEDQFIDGIHLKIINIKLDNKEAFFKRVYSFLSYSFISLWYALSLNADIVIASSGPITAGIPGLAARWLRRRKFVFEVRDLWPDGAIELGQLKNPVLIWAARTLEKFCYLSAHKVVVLSDGMASHINKRFKNLKISVVTNFADTSIFYEKKSNLNLPRLFFDNKVAIYAGNIGEVNNSYLLLRVAQRLEKIGRGDIKILIFGDGPLKSELKAFKNKLKINNLIIDDLIPKSQLLSYYRHSIASIVPLKNIPVLATSSPNKLFESLAAGVPVIQTTNGWISDFIAKNNCGFTVDSENEAQLVEKLVYLADNPQIHKTMSINCISAASLYFDKKILSLKMLDILKRVYYE